MKRVLFIVANIRMSNGVTSVIMGHYNELIKKEYRVDFCALYDRPSPWFEEIKKHGSKYYLFPQTDGNHLGPDYAKTKTFIQKCMFQGNYEIVHIHITGKYAVLAAKTAKKMKVPYRIFHAHNPLYIHDLHSALYTLAYHTQCVFYCNKFLACSRHAGKSYFRHRPFNVIKNTIEIDNVSFDLNMRKQLRKKLNLLDSTVVVGTVCRHTKQKNPYFTVDVFEAYQNVNKDSILMWVGTGELEQSVKEYVKKKGLNEQILFMGNQVDMKSMYSAMDVFLLPSLYEGLGIAYIEAQANGLPTFASDVVPGDTEITDLIRYNSLDKSADQWANEIKDCKSIGHLDMRARYAEVVRQNGYDKQHNHDLVDCYEKLIMR